VNIMVNGETRDVPAGCSVTVLIEHLGLAHTAIAVAVNREFVPRSAYADTVVREGDELELVGPMQGG
jgi:sulfur carrier protein